MKPIISPLLVYFANVSDGLRLFLIIVMGISMIIFGTMFLDDPSEYIPKHIKKFVIITTISALGIVFTPGKETIYTMIVLDQVTTDNIQAIGKTGKDIVDYIINQIDKVVNKDDEKEK